MKERNTREYRMQQAFDQEQLRRLEALCTQQQPPHCVARCPIHLDAKALCAAVQSGDFGQAKATMQAATPFVHLLGAGCEAPCMDACRLQAVGEAVDLRRLEAFVSEFPAAKTRRRFARTQKKQRIAVLGSDLFCLGVAAELERKGYAVDLYTPETDLAAAIFSAFPHLPQSSLQKDLQALDSSRIRVRLGHDLSPEFVREAEKTYDALCASAAVCRAHFLAAPDARTMQCAVHKLFGDAGDATLIGSLCAAKQAAISADRYLQGASLTVGRKETGAYESTLYTSLEGVAPSARVSPQGKTYTAEEAMREAERCLLCQCLECVKGCAYLQHYKRYPRQSVREIYNNLSIVMGEHKANGMINACNLCGQCAAICPNGLDLGEICLMARQVMVDTGKMPPSAHAFALQDMAFSNGDQSYLCLPPPGRQSCEYVFFPGCQMGAIAPDTLRAAYADLRARMPADVGLWLGCCGAIAHWAGQKELFSETLLRLQGDWEAIGRPRVIAGCPTCYATLREHTPMPVIGIWDALHTMGLPPGCAASGHTLALHDACGARNDQEVQGRVRDLLRFLGCRVQELPYHGDASPCCGYGGLVGFSNRPVAAAQARAAAAQSEAPYVTYCMNCRDRFVAQGKPAQHLLELIYGQSVHGSPSLSQRRYNRIDLKSQLQQTLWGVETMQQSYDFTLEIGEDVAALLQERMILEQDLYQVLQAVRAGGSSILEKSTGLCIASCRIDNATFWVKYAQQGDVYRIHSAYSHRMRIEEA